MMRSGLKVVRSVYRRFWRGGLAGLPRLLTPWQSDAKADVQRPSGYVKSQLRAATELLQSRRLEAAESVLNEALVRYPDHPDLLECRALVVQRDGRWSDALRQWQDLAATHPDRTEAPVNRVRILTKLQRFAEAEQVLREAVERWPDHPKLIEASALAAQRERRWSDALADWQNLTQRHPGRLAPWVRRIKVLLELRRIEEAEEVLRSASERWPDHPKLKEAKAHLLESEQRWSEALECWRDLSSHHPGHAASLVGEHIATCEIKTGDVGVAGGSLEEAMGAREEAVAFQRMFGSQARFIPYYGRQIEDAFRDLT